MAWLEEMAAAAAEIAGLDPSELGMPDELRDEILDLARIASHDSGERTNAPLLCYAIGLAVGKGASFEALAAAIRSRAG